MLETLFKVLMILLLSLLAVEGRAQPETEQEKKAEKEKKKKPPEISTKVYNKVAPSVVKIECDGGNKIGSGAIVGLTEDSRAIILTACHVVARDFETTAPSMPLRFYEDIIVMLATDTTTERESVKLDFHHREKDLALIVTREPIPEKNVIINYNRSRHTGPGTLVAAMGFPDSDKLSQTVGNIKRVEGGYLVFDAQIAKGSSGGPLIDKFGRMVGMSRSIFEEEEGYAVPFDSLSTVIDGWLQKIRLKNVWQRQKYGNFGERLRKDVRFIAGEMTIAGGIAWLINNALKPPVEPDILRPPSLP